MIKFVLRLSVPAVAVLLGAYLLPGVAVQSFGHAILVALLVGFLNAFVKPVLEVLTIPITFLTLGLFLIILDALMILAAAKLIDGFFVQNILWAIIFGFIVSLISSILNSIIDLTMKKVYHLGSCSTCIRIIRDLGLQNDFELQDIKKEPMTADQVDEMAAMAGSYEALFSRRAMKYKSMGLKDKKLTEQDYRGLILNEYTFLKRPVAILEDSIFIGNSPKVVAGLKDALTK